MSEPVPPARKRSEKPKRSPPRRRRVARKAARPPPPSVSNLAPSAPPFWRMTMRVLAFAVVAGAVASVGWFFGVYPLEKGPGDGHSVEVAIPAGGTPEALARVLYDVGVVGHPRLFALWVTLTGGTGGVVSGPHLLTDDVTPRELMARLERRGFTGSTRVTFPEGFNRFDMARRLEEKHVALVRSFLNATTNPTLLSELGIAADSAEGFLFPASYDFAFDADAEDVVRRLKHEFDRRWDILARAHSAALTDVMSAGNMSVRDLVTLASMIEKEAVLDEERPIIGSVFLNRLRSPTFKPKHLECDPTASYGCLVMPDRASSCAAFVGRATAAIEHDADNPYSTYTHEGLPPGPIANPGAKSLEAAMNPSNTPFLFFVARGEGRHTFSETYEAHVAAVHGAGKVNRVPSVATSP